MTYVITRSCETCLDAACVDVCPVDAIHGEAAVESLRGKPRPGLQLFIDPESCICCAACEPECPAKAIFDEHDLPEGSDDLKRATAFFARRE